MAVVGWLRRHRDQILVGILVAMVSGLLLAWLTGSFDGDQDDVPPSVDTAESEEAEPEPEEAEPEPEEAEPEPEEAEPEPEAPDASARFDVQLGEQFGSDFVYDVPGFRVENRGGEQIVQVDVVLGDLNYVFDAGYQAVCDGGAFGELVSPDAVDTGTGVSTELSYAFGGFGPGVSCVFHADIDPAQGRLTDYRESLWDESGQATGSVRVFFEASGGVEQTLPPHPGGDVTVSLEVSQR